MDTHNDHPLTIKDVPGATANDLLKLDDKELARLILHAERLADCAVTLTYWLQGIVTEKRLRNEVQEDTVTKGGRS